MPAKTRSRRPRRGAVPPAQAAAIAHARWLVDRVRGVTGALGRAGAALRAPLRSSRGAPAPAAEAPAEATSAEPSAQPAARPSRAAALAAEVAGRARAASPRVRQRAALARHGLTRAASRALALVAAALLALGRGLVRHHGVLLGLVHRLMWWGSLALLIVGGRIAIDPHGHPLAEAVPFFVGGFALCAFAILLAASPRIRVAAFALGVSHAGLALLLWTLTQG